MQNKKYTFLEDIDLHVENRIRKSDAERQQKTAIEILNRLNIQPGIVLADEVGMGKTFVALAVGISAYSSDPEKRPVVVMVPPSVAHKWINDFNTFLANCLKPPTSQFRIAKADKTEELLKLMDDPVEERAAIIVLTHGAMSRGLADPWVKLALIFQSLKRRPSQDVAEVLKGLERFVADILNVKTSANRLGDDEREFWNALYNAPFKKWKDIMNRYQFFNEKITDDPVPEAFVQVLSQFKPTDLQALWEDLVEYLPRRESSNIQERLIHLRRSVKENLDELWQRSLSQLQISSSLLIMDEAHHLKNAKTKIARLFYSDEAQADADSITKGSFANVFDRMLFLTATPFQLGHYELIGVLERFKAVNWKTLESQGTSREIFVSELRKLTEALDKSQHFAVTLERVWGKIKEEDLQDCPPQWWANKSYKPTNERVHEALDTFESCKLAMSDAESHLKKWVVRHLRDRKFEFKQEIVARRSIISGNGIIDHNKQNSGIEISGNALLPFLLAARASSESPSTRPVFSEGLASSYEAFLDTRKKRLEGKIETKDDDDETLAVNPTLNTMEDTPQDSLLKFYVDQIEKTLKRRDGFILEQHPKVAATVDKAINLWLQGEKVLIFNFYQETGKTLKYQISKRVNEIILERASQRLGFNQVQALKALESIQNSIDDRREFIAEMIDKAFKDRPDFESILPFKEDIVDVIKRMIRTQSFIVRYIPLEKYAKDRKLTKELLTEAFDKTDESGVGYFRLIEDFLNFIALRSDLAKDYLAALKSIKTGTHHSTHDDADTDSEDDGTESNATVVLVNGSTTTERRHRVMMTFNTPFFPEILIASSVMAEGVDLHLNCRNIIHHDLSWNPSALEQRNGRVDRIGAKVERSGKPINIYLPFVSATQDEKMFKVVMDRERWFKVVMGDKVKIDSFFETEKLAERLPFPEEAAQALSFKLEVIEPHK